MKCVYVFTIITVKSLHLKVVGGRDGGALFLLWLQSVFPVGVTCNVTFQNGALFLRLIPNFFSLFLFFCSLVR